MTYAELITQVKGLSSQERILLVEAILRGLREEMAAGINEPQQGRRQEVLPASKMRGIGKATGPTPTDQDLKDDYTNYLDRKYA